MKQLLLVFGLVFLLWGQAWSVPLYYSFEATIESYIGHGEWPSDGLDKGRALKYTFLIDLDNPDQDGYGNWYSLDYDIDYICGSFPMDAFSSFRAWEFFGDEESETHVKGSGPDIYYSFQAWDWDEIPMAEFCRLGKKTYAEIGIKGGDYTISQEVVSVSDRNPVPEPQTMVLLSFGFIAIIGIYRNNLVK